MGSYLVWTLSEIKIIPDVWSPGRNALCFSHLRLSLSSYCAIRTDREGSLDPLFFLAGKWSSSRPEVWRKFFWEWLFWKVKHWLFFFFKDYVCVWPESRSSLVLVPKSHSGLAWCLTHRGRIWHHVIYLYPQLLIPSWKTYNTELLVRFYSQGHWILDGVGTFKDGGTLGSNLCPLTLSWCHFFLGPNRKHFRLCRL